MNISLLVINPQIISRSCVTGVPAFAAVVVTVPFAMNVLEREIYSRDYYCSENIAHSVILRLKLLYGGDVVVHVFSHKGRNFYRLERLWEE